MASAILQGRKLPSTSYEAGSNRGSIAGYFPVRTYSKEWEENERLLSSIRADDLVANDWAAKSATNAIVTNSVGTGLTPQSAIAYQELDMSPEEANALQSKMEWLWYEWTEECHYRNSLSFDSLQALAVRSLVRNGEFLHLPVMEFRPGNKFALKLQDIKPHRLCTPCDKKTNPLIHDGVEITETGIPTHYWICSPRPSNIILTEQNYSSSEFRKIPAKIGHRRGIFHIFIPDEEEKYRGISDLSAGIKFFKHFNDAIDYELVAQIIAASFPVFISLEKNRQELPYGVGFEKKEENPRYFQEINPGSIMYGNEGEKPEILESKRPSQNFLSFCELVLRSASASLGLPYEEVSKDFSKTTYSSARAAMIGAWRIYGIYREFFRRHYCQPLWNMVMEEAYLRGYLNLPAGMDFYKALPFLCNCRWIGPARGYIDPLKEVQANILAIDHDIMTMSDSIAERGSDFDETINQREYEERRMRKLQSLRNSVQDKKQTILQDTIKSENSEEEHDK